MLAPEYSTAVSAWNGGAPVQAIDMGMEAGARLRLSDAFGVASLQATLKYAGPFDLSHGPIQKYDSIGRGATRTEEVRLLYGTGFKLFGATALPMRKRPSVSSPRRVPMRPISISRPVCGSAPKRWSWRRASTSSAAAGAQAPYTYFREHKLELSLVRCLSDRWSVQLGAFAAPMGQNTVAEQGLMLSVWNRRL